MNSSNVHNIEAIRKWLDSEFQCCYCDQTFVVKEIIGKRGCFVHRYGMVYSHPIGYPQRKPLYWKCCPGKSLSSVGCESCDHTDRPHPIPEHPYYPDIPLYFVEKKILRVEPKHTRIVKKYDVPTTRSNLLEQPEDTQKINIMESYVKIKRFF